MTALKEEVRGLFHDVNEVPEAQELAEVLGLCNVEGQHLLGNSKVLPINQDVGPAPMSIRRQVVDGLKMR